MSALFSDTYRVCDASKGVRVWKGCAMGHRYIEVQWLGSSARFVLTCTNNRGVE